MDNIFSRCELLIGKNNMIKIQKSKIAIFGLGGVGGYVFEALVRTGAEHIDIYDSDVIDETNINRQILADINTIGKYKTDIAKERALQINPNVKINCYNIFFSPNNSKDFDFSKYDYIIDAIDTVTSKIELIVKSNEKNVPIISCLGTGNKLEPTMIEVSDIYKTSVCPLAKVLRYELKKREIKKLKVVYSKETPIKPQEQLSENGRHSPASCIFVPATAGMVIASEVIKDIIKKG